MAPWSLWSSLPLPRRCPQSRSGERADFRWCLLAQRGRACYRQWTIGVSTRVDGDRLAMARLAVHSTQRPPAARGSRQSEEARPLCSASARGIHIQSKRRHQTGNDDTRLTSKASGHGSRQENRPTASQSSQVSIIWMRLERESKIQLANVHQKCMQDVHIKRSGCLNCFKAFTRMHQKPQSQG